MDEVKQDEVQRNVEQDEVKPSVEQDEVKPDVKHDQLKPDGEQDKMKPDMKQDQVKQDVEQDEVKPDGEQGKHNEPSTSIPAVSSVTTNPLDDELRKYHEAMFQLHRARICMNMWNIYNSYH